MWMRLCCVCVCLLCDRMQAFLHIFNCHHVILRSVGGSERQYVSNRLSSVEDSQNFRQWSVVWLLGWWKWSTLHTYEYLLIIYACTVTFYLPSCTILCTINFPLFLSHSFPSIIVKLFQFISCEIVVTLLSTHHWAQLSQFEWICWDSHLFDIINGYSENVPYVSILNL